MIVYFYTPAINLYQNLKTDEDLVNQSRGLEFWIHRTCYELNKRHSKLQIEVVNHIPEEGIIIFHKGSFPKKLKPTAKQYFVCVLADHGRHRFAQMHIVQNPGQLDNFRLSKHSTIDKFFPFASNAYIPHWPQPGIKKRDSSRGCKLENVGFFGNPIQFPHEELESIEMIMKEAGLNLQLKLTSEEWADYSETDLTLAIRGFGEKPYYNKPFSKVMNAVLAGSLVIGGKETANIYFKNRYYNELPVISSLNDLKQTIRKLQEDPCSAFEKLGFVQTSMQDLSLHNIANRWESTLIDVPALYERWRKKNVMRKLFLSFRSA